MGRSRPVRFGVTLPQIKRSWEEVRTSALEFDALRFDSVWVCDHLYGVPNPTLPIFEAFEGGDESMYLSDRDFHPSTKAHKLLADDIYQQLLNHDQVAPLLQP